jgi:hypothetical protein
MKVIKVPVISITGCYRLLILRPLLALISRSRCNGLLSLLLRVTSLMFVGHAAERTVRSNSAKIGMARVRWQVQIERRRDILDRSKHASPITVVLALIYMVSVNEGMRDRRTQRNVPEWRENGGLIQGVCSIEND